MRWPAFVIALLFVAGGIRSLVRHARRRFAAEDSRDQLLYAVYLTGRVGLWFAFAGMFLIFAFVGTGEDPTPDPVTGRLDVARIADYAWYVLVFAVLGVMQLLGAWFLGHRGGTSRPSRDGEPPTRRP